MCLKKSAVSYVMWTIMLLGLLTLLSLATLNVVSQYQNGSVYAAFGIIAAYLLLLFLLYFLSGVIAKRFQSDRRNFFVGFKVCIIEAVLVFAFLIAAFMLRVHCMPSVPADLSYYKLAQVRESIGIPVQFVQGSVFYYCSLLQGTFLIFGNRPEVGIWLQIVLQTISCLFFYLGIRRLTGRLCAIFTLLFMCFSAVSMDEGLKYSPLMLYLCIFGLVFWLCADYMVRSGQEEEHPVIMWIYTVVLGIFVGALCYIDVSGIVLLLLLICLGLTKREIGKSALWFLRYMIIVISGGVAFLLILFADGVLSGTSLTRVFKAWYMTYGTIKLDFSILMIGRITEVLWLPAIACVGIFSFWRRKTGEFFSPYVLLCLGLAALKFTGITVENMDGTYLMYIFMAALGAVAITELFHKPVVPLSVEAVVGFDEEESMEPDVAFDIIEEKTEMIEVEKNEMNKNEEYKIENPMPVPKKRERKTMDYAFEPKGIEMVFDIRVSDKDDFDI